MLQHVKVSYRLFGHRFDCRPLRLRSGFKLLYGRGENPLRRLPHSRRAVFPGARLQNAVFLGVNA